MYSGINIQWKKNNFLLGSCHETLCCANMDQCIEICPCDDLLQWEMMTEEKRCHRIQIQLSFI